MKQKYSNTQKQKYIKRYLSGESVTSITTTSKIPRSTFYAWLKEYQTKQSNPKEISLKNFRVLENKVKRLEGIIKILKTVHCTVHSPLQEKLYELEKLYSEYTVHMLCEALDVPRGTFYNHILRSKKDNTAYSKRREELRIKVQEIYDNSNQIFGAKKITVILKSKGYIVSEIMVRSLMQDMGLSSIRETSKKTYDKERQKLKNHIKRNFDTDRPNQVWVSDITYFYYNNKSYYICVIIDLYARMVIGYKIGNKNSTQLTKTTFKKAYEFRNPGNDLIFHTDRGSNYRSKAFCDYLKKLNVTQSFSNPYTPYDNSVMESFFASLKREELYRTRYRSEREFETAIDNYMIFYNTKRPHEKNMYKTPVQKEAKYYDKV